MIGFGNTEITKAYLGSTEIEKMYLGDELVFSAESEPIPNHACITFRSSSSNTLSLTIAGTASPVLYYSTDGIIWSQWDYSSLDFSSGHPVFLYGNNPSSFSTSASDYAQFVISGSGNVSCSGNIMVLVDGTETSTTIPSSYYFYRLFRDCTKLVEGPSLPATTLKTYCYYRMFYGCTHLTDAPALPATTLTSNCYNQMFRECSALTTAPDLPAIKLTSQSYYYMFYNCDSLNYVKALFTTIGSKSISYWLYGVSSTGTFIKNSAATWTTTGTSGVPTNWTIEYVTV